MDGAGRCIKHICRAHGLSYEMSRAGEVKHAPTPGILENWAASSLPLVPALEHVATTLHWADHRQSVGMQHLESLSMPMRYLNSRGLQPMNDLPFLDTLMAFPKIIEFLIHPEIKRICLYKETWASCSWPRYLSIYVKQTLSKKCIHVYTPLLNFSYWKFILCWMGRINCIKWKNISLQ